MALKEGVYMNLSNAEYHADPALGSTSIKRLLESPLQYWYNSPFNTNKESIKESAAMKVGTAVHTAILEPEKFKEEYSINRKVKSSTKSGILGREQFLTVKRIRDLIRRSEFSQFFTDGVAEASVIWKDEETGISCKARFDYLLKANIIIDLKTIGLETLSYKELINEIFSHKRKYYVQAAVYIEALRNLKKIKGIKSGSEEFFFFFVTKTEPLDFQLVKIEQDIIDLGIDEFRKALSIYKNSFEEYGPKEWRPSKEVESLTLSDAPAWFNYY